MESIEKKKSEDKRKKSLGMVKCSLRTERREPDERIDDVEAKYAMRGSYNSMPNPNSLSVADESCSYMHIPFQNEK